MPGSNQAGISPFIIQAPTTRLPQLEDEGYDPADDGAVQVQLTATNGRGESTTAIVPVLLQPGPEVDTPAEFLACEDPNQQPTAVSGGNRTVNDTDGQPGETIVLNGSGSSDPDPNTELVYTWSEEPETTLGQGTSPTLTVTLGPGVHNLQLTVQDESSGQNSFDTQAVRGHDQRAGPPDRERRSGPQHSGQRRRAGRKRHARRLGLDGPRRHPRIVHLVPPDRR